ncbi:MAG: hypothetical protein HOV80_15160 [Polyangiaceae bacterium]|nr:hypothetical protein [Polyangiaceae bacterium]
MSERAPRLTGWRLRLVAWLLTTPVGGRLLARLAAKRLATRLEEKV